MLDILTAYEFIMLEPSQVIGACVLLCNWLAYKQFLEYFRCEKGVYKSYKLQLKDGMLRKVSILYTILVPKMRKTMTKTEHK